LFPHRLNTGTAFRLIGFVIAVFAII